MDVEKHPWTECCVSEPNCPNLIIIAFKSFEVLVILWLWFSMLKQFS